MRHRTLKVKTNELLITLLEDGSSDGWPVVLSHGFPYDVHAFDEVVPLLVERGARVIRPYLRGFGPTSFLASSSMRSGQQAALGRDLIELLNALGIEKAIAAGFDWGGVASCVAAALWPDRVRGLVSYASYDIVDIAGQRYAVDPVLEKVCWYQHLFQSERGRDCLTKYRQELCLMLWREWSPNWSFGKATFKKTARSFDNPDFVDVVIHCYRFHFGLAEGDPSLDQLERTLATKPKINVPAVTLDGLDDPLKPGGTAQHGKLFIDRHEHRTVQAGHNVPQEVPMAFADALLTVHRWTHRSC
jgi:pimeloyl-ACP methyl ester carboxylesterase